MQSFHRISSSLCSKYEQKHQIAIEGLLNWDPCTPYLDMALLASLFPVSIKFDPHLAKKLAETLFVDCGHNLKFFSVSNFILLQ
jgi:hypothetical protein